MHALLFYSFNKYPVYITDINVYLLVKDKTGSDRIIRDNEILGLLGSFTRQKKNSIHS